MNTQANPIETEVEGEGQLAAGFLFASFKNTILIYAAKRFFYLYTFFNQLGA